MHIVIPMSGVGRRFSSVGYKNPKPLIEVDGKPIIEFVVSMFPSEKKFTFICNREHLETTPLESVLRNLVESAEIVPIEPHQKGPVYAVSQCLDRIDDEEEVIVNYCDFFSDWDYQDFLKDTRQRQAEGCVAAYRGFHPHMLGTDNYAFIRDHDRWLEAIQEKKPFSDNRMAEYASNGTYHFRRGRHIKRYFPMLMERDIQVNGEFYVSMIYNLLVEDGLPVSVYEVPHMLQWGTPKDLEEYQEWSNYFRAALDRQSSQTGEGRSTILIPMAGRGSRFSQVGYETPKPLIPVSGKPMVVQATDSLPPGKQYVFVALQDHLESSNIGDVIGNAYPASDVVALSEVTEGQASTCALGLERTKLNVALDQPLVIGACDNGMLFDRERFRRLVEDEAVDAVAFSFRNHPASKRNPKMYGWLATAGDCITGVSVKVPISDDPGQDHAIVGSFYFKKASYLLDGLDRMKAKNVRVNGEFYVDSLIGELVEQNLDCRVFEVDYYVCWGTPDDLKVYEYWQEFFDDCPWHPYKLEKDPAVDLDGFKRALLLKRNMEVSL